MKPWKKITAISFIGFIGVLTYLIIGFTFRGWILKNSEGEIMIGKDPDKSTMATDGPYVHYSDDSIIITKIGKTEDTGVFSAFEKRYPTSERNEISITCEVDVPNGDNFEISLIDSLNIPQHTYANPPKLLAISDIEGNFYAFKNLLSGAGVIDKEFNWTFGNGHLVLLGDFFDRGLNVTPCLWLIYKLDRESKLNGGTVHFIIGNHERMALQGDKRYVRKKYKEVAQQLGLEYKDLFGKNTELGRWLRSKNVVEQIGHTIYVHGGLSSKFLDNKLSLQQINDLARQNLDINEPDDERAQLVFHTKMGPLWYRGYFRDNLTQKEINGIVEKLGVQRIVVGHTIQPAIRGIFENKIIGIDIEQPRKEGQGTAMALWIENNHPEIIDQNGVKKDL